MCRDRSLNDDFPALAEYLPQNYVKELYQDDAVNTNLVPQKNTFLAQTPPFVQSCRGHIIISAEERNECELGIHNCDKNAKCIDTQHAFKCECNEGFIGNGFKLKSAATQLIAETITCVQWPPPTTTTTTSTTTTSTTTTSTTTTSTTTTSTTTTSTTTVTTTTTTTSTTTSTTGALEPTTTFTTEQSSTTSPEELIEPDYEVDEIVENSEPITATPIVRTQRRLPTNRDEIPEDMVLDFVAYEFENESEEAEIEETEGSEDFEDYLPQYEDETTTEIHESNEVKGQNIGRQRTKLFDQSFTRRERLNGARGRSISFGSAAADTEREKEMRGISRICRAVECLQNLRNFVDKRFAQKNFTKF